MGRYISQVMGFTKRGRTDSFPFPASPRRKAAGEGTGTRDACYSYAAPYGGQSPTGGHRPPALSDAPTFHVKHNPGRRMG
jgi:hypothetical protein